MKTVNTVDEVRSLVGQSRADGLSIGFVATMGNLHDGHMSLVHASKARTDVTVVSIFVNPFQFAEGEDFATYPRTLEVDSAKLAAAGIDLLFLPGVDAIYPDGPEVITRIEVPGLSAELCGAVRPQFFRGVCTVVNLLLNIVAPDVAFFGEKDYQQWVIVKRMVRDLHLLTDIVGLPTVRESDGLAMSSRNSYLGEEHRVQAGCLYRTLAELAGRVARGEDDFEELETGAMNRLRGLGFSPDYVSVRNAVDLSLPHPGCDLIVLGAAWLGETRLIDNVRVSLPGRGEE